MNSYTKKKSEQNIELSTKARSVNVALEMHFDLLSGGKNVQNVYL